MKFFVSKFVPFLPLDHPSIPYTIIHCPCVWNIMILWPLPWQTLYTKKTSESGSLETQPKLRCNGPERLRLNQVENSNLGGAGAWNQSWSRYKQIQTDSNFKHKKIGFVAFSAWNDCCMLLPLPRTRFGRCKKSSVWWGWRHAKPKFRVQTGRAYTFQNLCAALLDGNVTFGYGNSTESYIFPNFLRLKFLGRKTHF